MRIAFVYDAIYPWVTGGAERRFHELALRLRTRHDVHLIGWRWWEGPSTIERDGVTLHGLGRAPALYGDDGKRTVREAVGFSARLLPFLLRHRFEVIDCSATPYLPLYPAAAARRIRGGRLVATWHEFWGTHWDEYLPHRRLVARMARALEAGGRRAGDRVVAVSDFTARAMDMVDDPRMAVAGNGVDVEAIAGAEPLRDGAELVFVGRLIDEKRVDLLLDALAILRDRGVRTRCAIVGDGPQRPGLEAQAARLGIAERVRFQGRVPDSAVARQLRAARILVMPSLREGYGLAVAEGQAAGAVPVVVSSPFSGATDLVNDGVDGVVVEPTAAGLADGIGALLADPARLGRMAAAARETGAGRSWDAVADRMERIYGELLAEGPGSKPVRRLRWS
ncbi:MAG TPA: glycosyltransferase family 4 protein [Candidatus Limnocylindria bacterium]